ncbi:type II 3-dehydroquinate dehydratase [Algivirga pacifica]|uniref:3-dehydroquinate dehydratase n=1 Tax=Algivirga pacifica TaxID=1162670 RepID=A0ABP9DE63_9BACT
MKILVLNGPNLNLLGKREPEIYGSQTFEEYFEELQQQFPEHELRYAQSNIEGELVNLIHEVGFDYEGIVFNAGAYTHTSIALADAIAAVPTAVVEVHISNVHAREAFRHHSYLSPVCQGVMAGFGLYGYKMAIDYITTLY